MGILSKRVWGFIRAYDSVLFSFNKHKNNEIEDHVLEAFTSKSVSSGTMQILELCLSCKCSNLAVEVLSHKKWKRHSLHSFLQRSLIFSNLGLIRKLYKKDPSIFSFSVKDWKQLSHLFENFNGNKEFFECLKELF